MSQSDSRYGFPKSVRIIRSDDFGLVFRFTGPGSIRLGRDSVSLCAVTHKNAGCVRFGFTVGKHNVPRSVDRALVKRIMRECSRHALPEIKDLCLQHGIGMDISVRFRSPLKNVGRMISVHEAKKSVHDSMNLVFRALKKRIESAAITLKSTGE